MATFETQVEALTGISIDSSSNPTQTELSAFLVDGVKDVVNRMIEVRPAELSKFTNTTNSTSYVDKIGKILSVMREHDSTTILRKCAAIDPGDRYDATDVDSLNYRSKTSPGYYELDGAIYTVPSAGSGNNDIVVTQVHYDTGLVYGDTYGASNSSIVSFPSDYEYLVAIYAAIQSLQSALSSKSAPSVPVSQALPVLNITATDPTTISLTTVNYNPVIASASTVLTSLTAPTYTKPTLVLGSAPTISNLSITAVPPDVPTAPSFSTVTVSLQTAGSLGSAPSYAKPTVIGDGDELTDVSVLDTENTIDVHADQIEFDQWWSTVAHYIEGEEDSELAGIQLQKIATYISAFSQEMQSAMHTFNQANVAYQSTVQEAMKELDVASAKAQKDADLQLQKEIQEYSSKLQRYSAEVTEYQAEVNTQVQEYQQNLAGDIQVWQAERSTDLQRYGSDIQNELNEFNKESASFQYEVQKALADTQATNQAALQNGIQEARDAIENNNAQIARFQSMAQHYSTQVNEDVQKYTAQVQGLSADIAASVAGYGVELQGTQAEYLWLQDQYTKLKLEYDQAFAVTTLAE